MGWIQDQAEMWSKAAQATRVLLIPESNLDASDPESLMYDGSPCDHLEEQAEIHKEFKRINTVA